MSDPHHPPKGTIKKGPHGEILEADGKGGWHPKSDHAKETQHHLENKGEHH